MAARCPFSVSSRPSSLGVADGHNRKAGEGGDPKSTFKSHSHVAHLLVDGPDLVPVLQVVVLARALRHYELPQRLDLHTHTHPHSGTLLFSTVAFEHTVGLLIIAAL